MYGKRTFNIKLSTYTFGFFLDLWCDAIHMISPVTCITKQNLFLKSNVETVQCMYKLYVEKYIRQCQFPTVFKLTHVNGKLHCKMVQYHGRKSPILHYLTTQQQYLKFLSLPHFRCLHTYSSAYSHCIASCKFSPLVQCVLEALSMMDGLENEEIVTF